MVMTHQTCNCVHFTAFASHHEAIFLLYTIMSCFKLLLSDIFVGKYFGVQAHIWMDGWMACVCVCVCVFVRAFMPCVTILSVENKRQNVTVLLETITVCAEKLYRPLVFPV